MILAMPRYLSFTTEAEWMAWREAIPYSVGGGKLVEILGLGFKTPIRPQQARAGHDAEGMIIARACEVLECAAPLRGVCVEDEEEPWMRGSLDAHHPDVEIWEIKLVGRGWAQDWRDGCAPKVRIQGIWYSQLTSLPVRVIAVFLDDYAAPTSHDALERAVRQGAMRMWEFPLKDTLTDRLALVDAARAWREAMLVGEAPEPGEAMLVTSSPRPRIRDASDEEVRLMAELDAALRASERVEILKEQIRTRARGSAGLRGGGRLALVNSRGAVTLKDLP